MTPKHDQHDQLDQQDVKLRILLAAKKMFARYGYDGTSVRQICEEADANVALVSYHYGGKEKVFEEVIRTFLPTDRLPELEQAYDRPVQGLALLITEVTRLRHRDPELIAIINTEIELRSPRLPTLQGLALPFWAGLRILLRKGKEAGDFDFESLDQTMLHVLGTLFIHSKSHYFQPLMEEPNAEFEKQVTLTLRFVFRGLGYTGNIPVTV